LEDPDVMITSLDPLRLMLEDDDDVDEPPVKEIGPEEISASPVETMTSPDLPVLVERPVWRLIESELEDSPLESETSPDLRMPLPVARETAPPPTLTSLPVPDIDGLTARRTFPDWDCDEPDVISADPERAVSALPVVSSIALDDATSIEPDKDAVLVPVSTLNEPPVLEEVASPAVISISRTARIEISPPFSVERESDPDMSVFACPVDMARLFEESRVISPDVVDPVPDVTLTYPPTLEADEPLSTDTEPPISLEEEPTSNTMEPP